MNFRNLVSLVLLAAGGLYGQYVAPRFSVIPKSDGSATGEIRWYGLTGNNYLGFIAPNTVPNTIKWKLPISDAAGALCSDGALQLYFGCVGGGGGITQLNTLTAAIQTLQIGSAGTTPAWSTSGPSTHILNIPLASAAGVSAGLISNTSFAAFSAKQDPISASPPIIFSSNVVSCPTCVFGPGTSSVGNVPAWSNTTGTGLQVGYPVSATNTANSLVIRDATASVVANYAYLTNLVASPSIAGTAAALRRGTAGQTDPIQTWATETGTTLSSIDKDGKFTGNAATATALAANPANCGGGQAAAGVAADGTAEGCFTPGGGGNVTGSGTTVVGEVPAYANTTATAIGPGYQVSQTNTASTLVQRDASAGITANAAILTSVLAAPFTAGTAAVIRRGTSGQTQAIQTWTDQTGTLLSSIDKDGKFTGNAATATALAVNGANCSAGQAAAGVDASGAAEGCFTPTGGGSLTTFYDATTYGSINTSCGADAAGVIQTAINAAQNAHGGIVLLPPGCILINSQISQGNGSSSADSTKYPVFLVGAGMAAVAADPLGTEIRWGGGGQGSLTYMIKMAGPSHGGGIKNLLINANNATNVSAIDWVQWGHGVIEDVTIQQVNGGPALRFHVISNSGKKPANNMIRNLTINSPGTNGEGVYLTGCDATLPAGCNTSWKDAASNEFYGGSWWGTNYAVKLQYTDGNIFHVSQFQITNSITSTSCGILFSQSTIDSAFPSGNYFTVPFTAGYCGTMGTGDVPNHFLPLGECNDTTYCNPKTATTVGTPPFVISATNIPSGFRGLYGQGARSNSSNDQDTVFFVDNNSGSHDVTGVLAFQKHGVDQCRIRGRGNDGMEYWCKADGGAGAMTKQYFVSSWGEVNFRPITRTALSSYNSPLGALVLCVDCARDSSCSSSSGSYAMAFKKSAGSGMTAWTCNFQ